MLSWREAPISCERKFLDAFGQTTGLITWNVSSKQPFGIFLRSAGRSVCFTPEVSFQKTHGGGSRLCDSLEHLWSMSPIWLSRNWEEVVPVTDVPACVNHPQSAEPKRAPAVVYSPFICSAIASTRCISYVSVNHIGHIFAGLLVCFSERKLSLNSGFTVWRVTQKMSCVPQERSF